MGAHSTATLTWRGLEPLQPESGGVPSALLPTTKSHSDEPTHSVASFLSAPPSVVQVASAAKSCCELPEAAAFAGGSHAPSEETPNGEEHAPDGAP